MKIIRKISIGLLIGMLLITAIAGGYYLYQEKHKTPDEILELEAQKTEMAYKENLEYAMNASKYAAKTYDFIVVLNPAHGGMDNGYENAFGKEKDITLAICNQVIAKNTDPKIGIFLTRSIDVGMENEMRLDFVDIIKPDLFIDIHLNKSSTVNAYGTSVSYKTTYYNRKLSNVQLADLMEKNVVTAIEGFPVGIMDVTEEDNFPILNGLTMPAVSITCGDMSNEKEGELLSRTSYQQNLAKGIYDGIIEAKDMLTK